MARYAMRSLYQFAIRTQCGYYNRDDLIYSQLWWWFRRTLFKYASEQSFAADMYSKKLNKNNKRFRQDPSYFQPHYILKHHTFLLFSSLYTTRNQPDFCWL